MKKLLLFAFVLVAVNSFAQRIVDKEVGDFNEIKVFDLIEVNLIKADENRILIKGDHVDDIQFVNKDGVLKLRMQLEKKFQGEDTLIEVYYTDIDIIDGNEGAQIVCNETVAKDAITVKVQEGAQVKIGMDVRQLDARAVTGGIIEASGVAKNQVIVLNTGGIFEGRDLKTAYSSVKVSAGGEATLSASEKVDINVRAGGDVIVYGNPKEVNKNTLAGGRIFIKD
ncbi:MAG: head GIN domain-containing protein [Muriicola sp.]